MEFPVMCLILLYAGISDLKEKKIKNQVVFGGWAAGIALQAYNGGMFGMAKCILCIFVTIVVCMPVYHIGGAGAGDIKLFSVVSGLHGMPFACRVGVVFVILSGIFSICRLLKMNAMGKRIAKMYFLFRYSPRAAFGYYREKKGKEDYVIPLAPVLALAYFVVNIAGYIGISGVY